MSLSPQATYVHLSANGHATPVPGGPAFWALSPEEIERYGKGWLVAEFEFASDWGNWEMHPEADEFVYLLSGSVEVLLERPGGIESVVLQRTGAVVVPRGVWHTARVHEPSRMLHVTMGAGTRHRPVAGHDA